MSTLLGTNISAPIKPFTTEDRFPTHEASFGKGGYRTVNTEDELTSISLERLEKGMLVYTTDSDKIFKYIGDTSTNRNVDWEELVLSSNFDKYIVVSSINELESTSPTIGTLAYITRINEIYKYTDRAWEQLETYKIIDEVRDLDSIIDPFIGLLVYVKESNEIYKYTSNSRDPWEKLISEKSYSFTNVNSISINHTLNKIPEVIIVDTLGDRIYGEIRYTSSSNVQISFSQQLSGTVYLN